MWINHGHNDIWKCLAFSIKLDNSNSANVWEVCDEFISWDMPSILGGIIKGKRKIFAIFASVQNVHSFVDSSIVLKEYINWRFID